MSGVGKEGAAFGGARSRARAPAPAVSMVEEDEDYEGGEAEAEEGGGRKRARKLPVKKGGGGGSVTLAKPLQGPAKAPRDAYGSQAVPAASIGALCARFVATCMTPAGAAMPPPLVLGHHCASGSPRRRGCADGQGKKVPISLREAVELQFLYCKL